MLKSYMSQKFFTPGLWDKECYMGNYTTEGQIQNLEHQIQLQESNYKYAIELKKDCGVLRRMRYNIKALKELLQSIKEYPGKPTRNISPAENYARKDYRNKIASTYPSPLLRIKKSD